MRINDKSLFPYRGKYGSRPPLNFGRTKCHMQSPNGPRVLITDAYDGLIGPVWIAIPEPRFSNPGTLPVTPYEIGMNLQARYVMLQAAPGQFNLIAAYAREHMSPTSAMQASIDGSFASKTAALGLLRSSKRETTPMVPAS